jgi:ribose transport system substrate-binding protein
MANDFRKAQVLEAKNSVEKYENIKFLYSDAQGQTSLLIKQIDNFISNKVDVIIVGTNDAQAVVPIISKAYNQGIGVIILDRGINGNDYTSFINSDNIQIGKIGAEYIAKKLNGKGEVLLFEGLKKADVTHLRTKGFMDEISKYKDIKVIKRTGNYLRKDAIFETEKLVKDNIKFDAIFSQSDSMLSGFRAAYEKAGIDPSQIITVGCDYTSEAKEAILKGTQTASILFPLAGKQSVETALEIIAKKEIEKYIIIPVKLVDKQNVNEVKQYFND